MKTQVIHIRNSRGGPEEQYIGRNNGRVEFIHGTKGYFGNPIVIGKPCSVCGNTHMDGGSTLPCYRKTLAKRLKDVEFKQAVKGLYGKKLVCYCKPKPCHGDVLAAAAEYYHEHPEE